MTDKAITIDEAKRIVLEKYPDIIIFIFILRDGSKIRALFMEGQYIPLAIGWWWATEESMWLSAAHRIQKEKDK